MSFLQYFDKFDSRNENFEIYIERLENYFELCDIPKKIVVENVEISNPKKAQTLLQFIGRENYVILRNLVTPHNPSVLTYEEIKTYLNNYYNPKPKITAERYRFLQRKHRSDESINIFYYRFKKTFH